eukprot:RCo020645
MPKRKWREGSPERGGGAVGGEPSTVRRAFGRNDVQEDMKGALFSVNPRKRREAVTEIKHLVQNYLQPFPGSGADSAKASSSSTVPPPSLAAQLSAELRGMKQSKSGGTVPVLQTQVPGQYFVELPNSDVLDAVHKIAAGVISAGQACTRFVFRMVPVQRTCRSHFRTVLEQGQ